MTSSRIGFIEFGLWDDECTLGDLAARGKGEFFLTETCEERSAAPRSGTTFLGDAVSRAYDAAWPGEIFFEAGAKSGIDSWNFEDWPQPGNFFTFRAGAVLQRPELIYPDISARRALFDLYLQDLRAVFPNDRFLIDIKYTSWHHLDGFWRGPTDRPGLVKYARYDWLMLAESHLTRRLSGNMVRRIAALPAPTG